MEWFLCGMSQHIVNASNLFRLGFVSTTNHTLFQKPYFSCNEWAGMSEKGLTNPSKDSSVLLESIRTRGNERSPLT